MKHNLGLNCLGIYEEAVGTLKELTIDQGFLIAQISKVTLALPTEMEDKLKPLIGKRMGILHTDIRGKEYLVRIIREEKSSGAVRLAQQNVPQEKASA